MDLYYCLTFTFSLAATLICLSDFCFVKVQNTMGKTQNKFFVILLWIVALNGICTTLSGFYSIYVDKSELALYVIDQARYFYFVIHTALAPVFFFYISHVCGVVFRSNSNKKKYIYYSVLIICEALAITNPITNWVYYRDENNVFTRNWGEAVIYLVSAYFLFLSFKYLYTSWGALNTKRRSGLLMFLGITLTGIVAQLLNPDLKVELFAEAIGLTGVMMIIENEDDRIDIETGLYNRQAFILDLGGYFANKTHLHAISLRINTPEIISRKSGVANRELAEKR